MTNLFDEKIQFEALALVNFECQARRYSIQRAKKIKQKIGSKGWRISDGGWRYLESLDIGSCLRRLRDNNGGGVWIVLHPPSSI
jgi:hypothetical protein